MFKRVLGIITGLMISSMSIAAGTSIWNASPRGEIVSTDRVPVATNSTSGPLYVTPETIKTYIESRGQLYSYTMNPGDPGQMRVYSGVGKPGDTDYEFLGIISDEAEGWMQIKAFSAGEGADNLGIALQPLGTGALSAQVPDSDVTGGNERGPNSTDWQSARDDALQVASGDRSVISGGGLNTASGYASTVSGGSGNSASEVGATVGGGLSNTAYYTYSTVSGGNSNVAQGNTSTVGGGEGNGASGDWTTVSGGDSNTASGKYSWIPGGKNGETFNVFSGFGYGGSFGQTFGALLGAIATDDAPVVLTALTGFTGPEYGLVVPYDYGMACTGLFVVLGPGVSSGFECKFVATNNGGTTALNTGACTAIGTSPAPLDTTTLTLQANDTDDTIEAVYTGVAETYTKVSGEMKCSITQGLRQ